jgi:MarR family transcriptional regulator, transcriptional regulator for hemolysin
MAPPNDLMPAGADDWYTDMVVDRPSEAALQPGVGHRVHAVARLIRRRFERNVRQAGLPITRLQASLLIRIARNPGISQTTAAAELDVEPIALVRMLDRLHEEGLVERRPHATDRRVRTLWLTPLAWPVVNHILAINRAIREEACAGLSPAVRDMLMDALDHMKNNLAMAEAAAGDQVEPARVAEETAALAAGQD